jgi:HSP20 family protein
MLIVRQPSRPARSADSFDRLFHQLTSGLYTATAQSRTPSVDAAWVEGDLRLTVDLPGVPQDAVRVEVADRSLTLAADHHADGRELHWSHSLQLGPALDAEHVAARYSDGRLTVTVPQAPKPEARQIAIEGPAEPAVEATSTDAAEPTES